MQLQNVLEPLDAGTAHGSPGLAEALLLVRGSTLKLVRLQLALERDDRRVALEALDDLLALDRQLNEQLAKASSGCDYLREQLESDRSAVDREKLTLAAGISNGAATKEARPQTAVLSVETDTDELAATKATVRPGGFFSAAENVAERLEPVFDQLGAASKATPADARNEWKRWTVAVTFLILALAAAAFAAVFVDLSPTTTLFELIGS